MGGVLKGVIKKGKVKSLTKKKKFRDVSPTGILRDL